MSAAASYRPSPLSFNSPRASPFRRPESPSSPSPLRHSTTPTNSPTKAAVVGAGTPSPSKLNHSNSPATDATTETWTPRGLVATLPTYREPPTSPTRGANSPRLGSSSSMMTTTTTTGPPRPIVGGGDMNGVSKLQPAQVRELREGFQILDRDSDGIVGRDDVADMLTQLGLPSSATSISQFFPPSTPQTLTLPTFLTQISTQLSAMSPPSELLNAFAAFDEEDSGQVDLAQLREALLGTAPEAGDRGLTEREIEKIVGGFSGRRAFGKGPATSQMQMQMGKRGEVFRYQEFVQSVVGAGNGNGKGGKEDDGE